MIFSNLTPCAIFPCNIFRPTCHPYIHLTIHPSHLHWKYMKNIEQWISLEVWKKLWSHLMSVLYCIQRVNISFISCWWKSVLFVWNWNNNKRWEIDRKYLTRVNVIIYDLIWFKSVLRLATLPYVWKNITNMSGIYVW